VDCTKKHIEQQRILSFCYGYGGLERGISEIIPTRTVAYVEIEAFQNFNLVSAMESGMVDKAPIWTNLKTFDAKPFHNRIHGIVGGYPCQGESHAGKRELWNDERFLWPYIEKAIIATNPFWCFFENVSGHLTGSFPYILDSLRSLGYTVEAGLFTADEVGAPHERKRVFILAMGDTQGVLLQRFGSRSREKQFRGASNELSDSICKRLQGGEFWSKRKGLPRFCCRSKQNKTLWPAKRGQSQYEWEAYRTVEPGVGCTVNGYNFRTELLRQYGNGVVSQTAALAFETLLDKMTLKQ